MTAAASTATSLPTLISLERWAEIHYGEEKPTSRTLQSWAREGKIRPKPMKHGRSYFVSPDATYVDPKVIEGNKLLRAIYGDN